MSEKAQGKRKAAETDDEGAEDKEKTDGGRKRRWVMVRDPEETDWVKRIMEFMGRMEEWEKRREARESRQEDRAQRMMVMMDRMVNQMERLVVLTKEVLAELREDGEGELEDGKESWRMETEAEKQTERMTRMGRTRVWRTEGRSVGGVGKDFVNSFLFVTKDCFLAKNDKKDNERKERKSGKNNGMGDGLVK